MSDNQTPESGSSKAPIYIVLLFIITVSVGGLFYLSQSNQSKDVSETVSQIQDNADAVLSDAGEVIQDTVADTTQAAEDAVDTTEDAVANATNEGESMLEKASEEYVISEGDPVVAKVNEMEIKRSEVMDFISNLPDQLKALPLQTTFPLALDEVVTDKVVEKRITEANFRQDPEVEKLVKQAREQIARSVYLERAISEEVTEEKLRAEYDRVVAELDDVLETRARHILVEEKDQADALIQQLNDGADFAELAKTNSTGPTGQNGGDLGYFTKKDMVPEFAEAAFSLEPGSFTTEPVQTQFGWHVIKVEDRRNSPKPDFELVRPQIEQKLNQEVAGKLLSEWKGQADVEKFSINGEPLEQ